MKNETLKPNFKPNALLRKSLAMALMVTFSMLNLHAAKKSDEPEKTVHARIELTERPEVFLSTYNKGVQILPSTGNYIEVYIKYVAESNDPENLKILHQQIEKNLIQKNGKEVKITMKPYKSYGQIGLIVWNYIKMEFEDGTSISLSKYKTLGLTVYLPEDMDLNIDARYGSITQKSNVRGNLKLDNYDADYYGQEVTGNVTIDARYSQIEFSGGETGNVKLYESKLKTTFKNNLTLESRYSKINLMGSGTLNYIGYEDELRSNVHGAVKMKTRYCEVEFMTADEIDANMYEGSLTLVNLKNKLKLNSRYLKANITNANEILMDSCYETDLILSEVNKITSAKGKYNKYNIGELKQAIDINGYEESIDIKKVSNDFDKIYVDGKYIDLTMNIDSQIAYKLYGKVKYPDFNFEKDDYDVKLHDQQSSTIEFEYYKHTRDTYREIKINGYEVDVNLND